MTRLEVSILHAALKKYRPDLPSLKTLWHERMQNALELLIKQAGRKQPQRAMAALKKAWAMMDENSPTFKPESSFIDQSAQREYTF